MLFWRLASAKRKLLQETEDAAREERLVEQALQTAELVNTMGALVNGSEWKHCPWTQFYNAWTGREEEREVRKEKSADALLLALE